MMRAVLAVAAVTVAVSGCQWSGAGPREEIGALTGAVAGAFLGNEVGKGRGRVLATAAGTLAGTAIGADIGRSLDRANALYAVRRPPVGHSQQAPVPGFATERAGGTRQYAPGNDRGLATRALTIRDAQECRSLDDDGLRPTYACRNRFGQWFILQ